MAIDIGTTLDQRYLLQKELGRGGMGAVYSANDELLQRRVAIKVLKEQSTSEVRKKLRLEAQIAARLLHDYVVRIYDLRDTDATYYLVMEEVQGTTYSKRWRHLALAERLRILAQVAEALDYAHHQGVIHRDVKPANVLVTTSDTPKLSDFGLSTIAEEGDTSGVVKGTPHYMSPEQTRGSRLDYRTDLYSLGVMIYESATGTLPFSGTSISIMSQHFSAEPEPPRSRNQVVSLELDVLIRSLLAKKPDARPVSGAAVAQALREEIERIRERESSGLQPSAQGTGTRTIDATSAAATELVSPTTGQASNGPVKGARPSVTVAATISKSQSASSVRTDLALPAPSVSHSSNVLAMASVGSTGGLTALIRSPLARRMLEVVLAEPVALTAEERYLHGHYLAYLLSGSRRRGLFLRRPLEPRNADRGRLLLAMTYAVVAGGDEEAVRNAAMLLDQQIEVRPILSPLVMAKYLNARVSPGKRKLFRQTRKALAEASKYAQKHMIDAKGVLNPGLMPQRLDDLKLLAPPRDDVDDVLVERWNRVSEVWRNEVEFRTSVLRYATTKAYRDPASAGLWPEVVYPLIERARWHRRIRSRAEVVLDYICGQLHVPQAGVALDRVLRRSMPAPIYADIEDELQFFADSPGLDAIDSDPFAAGSRDQADRLAASLTTDPTDLPNLAVELDEPEKDQGMLQLADPDPLRFFQGQLHDLWKEAVTILQSQVQMRPGVKTAGHCHVPVGPYRLIVIPSLRGRAAGQIAIQGMTNKQIEMTTPPVRTKGSSSKPLLAVWIYEDNSLAIAHLDFMNSEKFVIWNASRGHQLNFDDAADFNHELYTLGMEVPDQVNKVLTRHFKPRAPQR